jgi:hypothetical protein
VRLTTWLLFGVFLVAGASAARAQDDGGDELPPMLKNPRMVSGFARPEQGDPPGRLTVRTVQGGFHKTEFGDTAGDLPDAPIHLVSIDRKGVVAVKTATLDKGGRVTFDGLATDGSISYWVLSVFSRAGGEDRVMSRHQEGRQLVLGPVDMLPGVGLRMMLAGAAKDAKAPPIDDLLEAAETVGLVPAGEAWIDLDGDTDSVDEVELLEAGSEVAIATVSPKPIVRVLDPQGRMGDPQADPALGDGVVEVLVERRRKGVEGISVELVSAAETEGGEPPSMTGTTDASGAARFAGLNPGAKVALQALVHGRPLVSRPFTVPAQGKGGLRVTLKVDWLETDSLRATFTGVAAGKDKVYIARSRAKGRAHLSPPFQLTQQSGAAAQILVFAGVAMSFHGGAELEEERLGFQIQFTIFNPSVIPFDPGPDGLRIPLPRGASGAGVDDESTARVKVNDDSLVWRGAVAPGQKDFIGGFSIPVEDGVATLEIELPYGTFGSQIMLEDMPGMRIDVPAGVEREPDSAQDGRPLVKLGNIKRKPGESLSIRIAGLPQHAAWKLWGRRAVSLLALGLVAWLIVSLVIRLRGGRTAIEELEARREELLQTLVQLEADHERKKIGDAVYRANRATLAQELEGVYAALGAPAAVARAEEDAAS